jgi:amino acid transporter
LILFICCFCTFSTSVSLAALCSNGRMSTGGSYFLFSRALGAPLGTAIGFCFWFATTVSAGFYIIGVAETYIQVGWPVPFDTGDKETDFYNNVRVVGVIVFGILLTINLFGLKYVSQAGILFLILVFMGIAMAYIGIGTNKWSPKL